MTADFEKKIDEAYSNADKRHWLDDYQAFASGYIAGAKDNGVVWHDLRKNPDDLPKESCALLIYQQFESCRDVVWATYYKPDNTFISINGGEIVDIEEEVIAWCEIPKFSEVEK